MSRSQTGIVVGKDQHEIEKNIAEAIKEYGRRKTVEIKVIFYTFKSMVRELNFDGDNSACGYSEMCSLGVGLDLWFRIGYVIKDPTQHYEIYVNEKHEKFEHYLNIGSPYMVWTKEREQFFLAFREWLIGGVEKMQGFFKDTKALPQLMDNVIRKNQLPFIQKSEER